MDAAAVGAVDDGVDDVAVRGTHEPDATSLRVSDFEVLDAHVIMPVDQNQRVVDSAARMAAGAFDDRALASQALLGRFVLDVVRADGRIRRARPGPVDGELALPTVALAKQNDIARLE